MKLADQANPDGAGAVSIQRVHECTEISERTIQCHLKIFENIGLLEPVQWGEPISRNPLRFAFQISIEKLGTDLRKDFTVALSKVSELVFTGRLICP